MKRVNFEYMKEINVDLELKYKKTVLHGDSATGKTYMWTIIDQYQKQKNDDGILCLNRNNTLSFLIDAVIDKIKTLNDALIVIDQADDVLANNKLKDFVLSDDKNYYILMGRNVATSFTQLAFPVIDKYNIKIQYTLNSI